MKACKNRWLLWSLAAVLVVAAALAGCSAGQASGEAAEVEGTAVDNTADDNQNGPAAKPEAETLLIPLGLYVKDGNGSRERKTSMEAAYAAGQDIVVLSAFFSEEPTISGAGFAGVWNGLREGIPEATGCKIGYRLNYETASGETVSQTILGPGDTEANRAYVETYIYDDVHQDGWYSHLLPADVTEQTVVTTIKLTGGPEVAGVGDITVEAFLYQEDPAAEPVGRCRVEVTKQ